MTKPATALPLTPRERLRLRRAMDAHLIDAIFGVVVRDAAPPHLPSPVLDGVFQAGIATGGPA